MIKFLPLRGIRILGLTILLLLPLSCSEKKAYSVQAAYLLAGASLPGLSVRAGGYVYRGDDLARASFSFFQFHSVTEASDIILLCHENNQTSWYIIKSTKNRSPKIPQWFAEGKIHKGKISSRTPWLRDAMAAIGVRWKETEEPNIIEGVILSTLTGTKGMVLGSQIKGQQIKELSNSLGQTRATQWVDTMLNACSNERQR
ncbi:MAG: hypothetical protein HRU19_01285 [Pseudobacteriovorax sp.]|nr:hypothetical protein [Pseudobacteriovorax sp.]